MVSHIFLLHSGPMRGSGKNVCSKSNGSGQIPESNQNTGKQPKYRKAHINTGKHPNIGVYGGKGMLELLLYVHLKMYLNDSKF